MLAKILSITSVILLPCAHADVIRMSHGDRLTGTIQSLSEQKVTLASPLTPTPLEVKPDSVQKITFDNHSELNNTHTELLTLSNGDTLPCSVISLDSQTLNISTWYAGPFSIPRTDIKILQFGISPDKPIYLGMDPPSEWDTHKGGWSFTNGGYICDGAGTLARKLDFPNNLRINFDLTWENTPNLAVRFLAANDSGKNTQDCYEFTFSSYGIKIQRLFKKQKPTPITSIDLVPHTIISQKINIDLKINRDSGQITLALDGVECGTWIDSLETLKGNHIVINTRNSRGKSCNLANLKISEWMKGQRSRPLERLNQEKVDILLDSEGEKISGHISSIQNNQSEERVIKLKVKYSKDPILVPDHRLCTLIFSKQSKTSDKIKTPKKSYFSAQFVGGGTLQLTTPKLDQDKITTTHPILGNCTLNTSVISHILYHQVTPPQPKEPTPNPEASTKDSE